MEVFSNKGNTVVKTVSYSTLKKKSWAFALTICTISALESSSSEPIASMLSSQPHQSEQRVRRNWIDKSMDRREGAHSRHSRRLSAQFQSAQHTGYHSSSSVGNQMSSIKNRLALKHRFTYLSFYTMFLIKDSFQLETVVL